MDNFGSLRADFRRFYGLDLAAMTDALEVRDLIRWLPPESVTMRATEPEAAAAQWTPEVERLTQLVELTHDATLLLMAPHMKKGWKPPKALHVPRPWDKKQAPPDPQLDDMRRFFGAENVITVPRKEVSDA